MKVRRDIVRVISQGFRLPGKGLNQSHQRWKYGGPVDERSHSKA